MLQVKWNLSFLNLSWLYQFPLSLSPNSIIVRARRQRKLRIKLGFKISNVAKCNLGKVKLQANAVSGLLLQRTWSERWPQGPFAYLVTYVASHTGIFELIFVDLLLSELLWILFKNFNLNLILTCNIAMRESPRVE